MILSRRKMLTGLAALVAAPAVIRVAGLMPVKAWIDPPRAPLLADVLYRDGWVPCDGRALPRIGFEKLFDALGTHYGPGDGRETFNVPDLRPLSGWASLEPRLCGPIAQGRLDYFVDSSTGFVRARLENAWGGVGIVT